MMACLSLVRVSLIEDDIRNPKGLCHVHHTSEKKKKGLFELQANLCMSAFYQKKNVCNVCMYEDAPCASKSPKKHLRTAQKVVSCTPHINKKIKSL